MSLIKLGSQLRIIKTAASIEGLLLDKPVEATIPKTSIISPVLEDHLFYRARAISAGDQGPMDKNGDRGFFYNGNFDFFPRKELEAAYPSFVQKNIFLDHNSESSLYSIGKILDSYPVEDPETGEFYIEILGRIDKMLHPEIARKIQTGELNSTSMGCSVDESICSVCSHVLHSDADEKCSHLSQLGKKFEAEVDFPEYNIKKGEVIPAFSINRGIQFNEDSIVGVPADPTAVIKAVVANMKCRMGKKASLTPSEQTDFVKQFENLLTKVDENTKISLKAEFNSIFNKEVSKESSMSETNLPNSEVKKVLDKISALEMEQLESYIAGKTKKANEIVNKEVVADATKKEETFLSKIVAKVKDSFAAQLLEKKVEAVAKEELGKEASEGPACREPGCKNEAYWAVDPSGKRVRLCDKHLKEVKKEEKKSSLSAKFNEDKNNVLASTWSVYEGDKLVLDASLKDIWGSQFETLSFADQKWATSEAYGKEAIARYQKEGVEKLADLWDVSHKLNKTAEAMCHCGHPRSEHEESDVAAENGCAICDCPAFSNKTSSLNSKALKSPYGKEIVKVTVDQYEINKWEVYTSDIDGAGSRQRVFSGPDSKEKAISYAKELAQNLGVSFGGVHKETSLKTAAEPKLGPSGTRAKPSTGTDNKKHDYPTQPKFTDSKPGANSKGPAAPKPAEVKTETKIDMPGQEKGQTGPAAPKAKEVKTDYAEPKPEAEGKEVKTTPKNPEEKKMEKSEKEVETSYVAKGTEAMEEEKKEDKKEEKKSSLNYKQANAQIKWSAMSPEAQEFIKKHVEKHIKEDGMEQAQAVAAAYSEAKEKGMDVPSKQSSQETDMKKQAADKPVESVDGSTLPEGTKTMGDKVEESVQGTTVPGGAKPSAAPETSAQGDKEHKTLDLTKKPVESVDGTTLPPQGKKDEESVEKTTHPDSKKTVGTEPEKSVQASKSESAAPIEAVQDKPALSKATAGDTPESAREGGDLKTDPKHIESVNKEAATEMPMPEDKPVIEEKPEVPAEHETENLALPVDGPKVEAPKAEVSAFDTAEKVDVGEGYSAHKDKETKEIIVEKEGKEIKRLPDGFGADVAVVTSLLKAVLGLPPAEEAKPEVPAMAPVPEEHKEEPKVEEHPALEEAHEDELGIKESSLKAKEAELIAKEAELKTKEEAARKVEVSKKFADMLKVRSERCKKIVADMVAKDAIQMNKEVYDSERQNGTYLLDAQKKAFETAITAKQKELLAMDDNALLATEKVVADLKAPIAKRASRIYVSPEYTAELSEDETLKRIFNSMGTKQHPQ